MAQYRPSLSIALPDANPFQRSDHDFPTTPDQRHEELPITHPPPPPRQTYKVKRKSRASLPLGEHIDTDTYDHAIPTIEMSEAADSLSSPTLPSMTPSHGLLAPTHLIHRAITPPKTPAPRITVPYENIESPTHEWGLINDSRDRRPIYGRAGSVCSALSDSSISSIGSGAFSAPYSASLSPDSETTDPFIDDEFPKDRMITSPAMSVSPLAKRMKTHRQTKWTTAMDDHLWMTYMAYVADPIVTPFKMLPGTTPPLGVCYRVAAKAKRTWKDRRSTSFAFDPMVSTPTHREGSPDTIRPEDATARREAKQPQWPRSEGATRRRLRHLCKNKPSFSAHYQRLLRTRSPSPFNALGSEAQTSEVQTASSASTVPTESSAPSAPSVSSTPTIFSGSDMKMSLITSTNPSMQPDGPLAQLNGDNQQPRPQSQRSERPDNWFARIGRSQAHQKSQSLQSGLGLHTRFQPSAPLASPFDERSHILKSSAKSWGRSDFNVASPSLDSPFEISGAPTAPRSLKRRFRPDDEKPKRPAVQDIFGSSNAVPIVRNRGFTVGASSAADNLARLFTPPTMTKTPPAQPQFTPVSNDQEMADRPEQPDFMLGARTVPRRMAEPTPRLGSPFVEAAATRQFNTFPRSYIPSNVNPQPFQQRLKELAVDQQPTR